VMAKKIKQDEVAKEIKKIDGIEYVAVITGDADIMAKAVAKDTEELNTIITKKLRNIDGVDKTQTMIVLEQI
ncbi:MAG TPA: Lrp/AsnC ligand binding domain-containing protein, partial [archaeon]|nr:Lrp/AsnC ligand binding domain-containing protein [archaeon]